MWAHFRKLPPKVPLEGQNLDRSQFGQVDAHASSGGRALKPYLQKQRSCMASDMSVERVPGPLGQSGPILIWLFRIVLLTWVFVTAVVLWKLR